jgi:hypothetical protein
MVTLVTISMKQDVNLVAEDYYKQEIEYQDQIDRLTRTKALVIKPEVLIDRENHSIVINMQQEGFQNGKALFFRPADATMDKWVSISGEGAESVSIAGWNNGLWKVRLEWTSKGEEFYMEKIINL